MFLIITGNEIKNKNIKDFIDYVNYNNMEIVTSKIYSVFDILYKQYEIERLNFYKKHNRISKYDTENLIYYLLVDIIKSYNDLEFKFLQKMNYLIRDKSLLNEEERKYVTNPLTHVDFLVYGKFNKVPILVIEVDGYKYHKEGSKQHQRDLLKNRILEKYDIPLLKLKTNGSGEEKKIREYLKKCGY